MANQLSNVAQVAKNIRKGLKAQGLKATVKIRNDEAVRVIIIDATQKQYENAWAFCNRFQLGQFCGMTDIYVENNVNMDMAQVDYVIVDLQFSDSIKQEVVDLLATEYKLPPMTSNDLPETILVGGHEQSTRHLVQSILIGGVYPLGNFWEKRAA